MAFMGAKIFGGIMPRIDAGELPFQAAQMARNVDLTGRNLKAINFSDPFYSLNDGEKLVDGIPSGEVVSISTPSKPTVVSERILSSANITTRLTIAAYRWLSYLNPDTNAWVVAPNNADGSIVNLEFTEYGLRIDYAVPSQSFMQKAGIRYLMNGPLFQFKFTERLAADAGPDSSQDFSATDNLSPENAQFPQCMMPFSDSDGNIMGYFQVVRCDHPSAPEEFYDPNISEAVGVARHLPANENTTLATFYVDMNYTTSGRQWFYYVQADVDGSDREGPPSDISDAVQVRPGEMIKITGANGKMVYRSIGSRDGFAALEGGQKVSTSPYYDNFTSPLGQELPMYGNPPTFNQGNLLHPAQFGVAFKAKEVWFSDVYRLHVWPEEWMVKFDTDIMAIQLIGSSVIAFTEGPNGNDGKVYMMTGSDPRYMARYEIVSTAPLLNKLSLCKIGQSLFYVSNDGLMAVTREGAQNLTDAHYTREDWLALTPSGYSAKVANSSVFLECPTGMVLAGWGFVTVNDEFPFNSFLNDRKMFELVTAGPTYRIFWTGTEWQIYHVEDELRLYYSTSDVATPDLATGWVADEGTDQIGTVTPYQEGTNLRIDLKEGIAKVSDWTEKSDVAGLWQSRLFTFSIPVRFNAVRVMSNAYPEGDDAIKLIIRNEDSGTNHSHTITGMKSTRPPRMAMARNWSFTIELPKACEIEHISIASSTAELEIINKVE